MKKNKYKEFSNFVENILEIINSNKVSEDKIISSIFKSIDLSPSGIIKHLKLQKPIYSKTSAYGHFGQSYDTDGSFSWEKTDLTEILKKNIS